LNNNRVGSLSSSAELGVLLVTLKVTIDEILPKECTSTDFFGSCLDLNAKPVRADEFGRQLGNRAAGPRHGVHSQLLPSKNSLTWRSEVQSSGEGDASKASGLRSPVILVAKRNLTAAPPRSLDPREVQFRAAARRRLTADQPCPLSLCARTRTRQRASPDA
jgi:hypothetical protein